MPHSPPDVPVLRCATFLRDVAPVPIRQCGTEWRTVEHCKALCNARALPQEPAETEARVERIVSRRKRLAIAEQCQP